jgi:cytochrome P450
MNGNIPYLDAVIEEILRLSHTFALLERQSTEATTILGHPVPKGTTVFMPMYGPSFTEVGFKIDNTSRSESSRNALRSRGERKWPESNMNDFCPERWLREVGNEKEAFDRTAGPFLAFGLGKRGCFGQKLAYLEMKLVLTLIIWHFELQPCPHKLSSYEDVQGDLEKLFYKPLSGNSIALHYEQRIKTSMFILK